MSNPWTATASLCPWNFPGKKTGMGCHFLPQGIFPNQGLNPCLLHCKQILYRLSHQGVYQYHLVLGEDGQDDPQRDETLHYATYFFSASKSCLGRVSVSGVVAFGPLQNNEPKISHSRKAFGVCELGCRDCWGSAQGLQPAVYRHRDFIVVLCKGVSIGNKKLNREGQRRKRMEPTSYTASWAESEFLWFEGQRPETDGRILGNLWNGSTEITVSRSS